MSIEKEKKSELSLPVSKEDLCCLITRQIFFDPVGIECGHVFERLAIKEWFMGFMDRDSDGENERQPHCPCCRTVVDPNILVPALMQKALIAEWLKSDSSVAQEQYFSPELVAYLNDCDTSSYRQFIDRLVKTPQLLSMEDEAGIIFLSRLLTSSRGFSVLRQETKLRQLITSDQLEDSIVMPGLHAGQSVSVLYFLSVVPGGLHLLTVDDLLRSKVTPKGLNTILASLGPAQGKSPLWWFTAQPLGLTSLISDEQFRAKITSSGLNAAHAGSGPHQGTSPLWWLTKYEQGQELLSRDRFLRDKITWQGLNTPATGLEKAQGISPLWMLVARPKGVRLLSRDPALRMKITSRGLNMGVTGAGSSSQGTSPLLVLATTPQGLKLLISDDSLRAKISPDGLNAPVIGEGPHQGISPIWSLARNPQGVELLRHDPALRAKITGAGLNACVTGEGECQGTSPLYYFLSTADGRRLLRLDSAQFCGLITEEGISAIWKKFSEQIRGEILKWFVSFSEGKKMLRSSACLQDQLNTMPHIKAELSNTSSQGQGTKQMAKRKREGCTDPSALPVAPSSSLSSMFGTSSLQKPVSREESHVQQFAAGIPSSSLGGLFGANPAREQGSRAGGHVQKADDSRAVVRGGKMPKL